jgi:hypothetical protein
MASKTIKCTCSHADQDKMYGQGNRMANETRSGQLRCTVCKTLHGTQSMVSTTKVKAKDPASEPVKEPEKKGKEKRVKGVNKTQVDKKAKASKGKKDAAKNDAKAPKKSSQKGGKR